MPSGTYERTPEHLAVLSQAVSTAMRGRIHSAETRARMSATAVERHLIGSVQTPEALAKRAIAMIGNKNGVGNHARRGVAFTAEHRANISAALRARYAKQGIKPRRIIGVCVYCGWPADTLDHVIPRSRGGTDDPENLAPACVSCNSSKWALTPDEWKGRRRR